MFLMSNFQIWLASCAFQKSQDFSRTSIELTETSNNQSIVE